MFVCVCVSLCVCVCVSVLWSTALVKQCLPGTADDPTVSSWQEPMSHDDDMELVFFFVGRLRMDPQTFVVRSFHLNCWI